MRAVFAALHWPARAFGVFDPGTSFARGATMTISKRAAWGACLAIAICAAPVAFAQSDAQSLAPQQTPQQSTPPQQPSPQQTPQAPQQQTPQQQQQTSSQPDTQPAASDPDMRVDVLQPDFTLVALPTTLRLPRNRLSFRVTHRFFRSLGADDFGGLVSNLFQLDSGAQIGLELRYGLLPGTQVGIHRTSDRTIEIFGQQSVWQEKPDGRPVSVDVMATFEGTNNLRDQHSGGVGLLVSRKIHNMAAVYVEPIFEADSNLVQAPGESKNTGMVGLGARVRVLPKLYLVGELTPRFAGYKPGANQGSFAVESRVGGHTFQLNFSNGYGTTLGQIARGGINNKSWFVGFNISRKFY